MAEVVFPQLPGMAWGLMKVPMWASRVQKSVSGKRQAIGYMSYPNYKFTVNFAVLREYGTFNELETLQGFFNQMKGQVDTFKFVDPSDAAITTPLQIGTGNGVLTQFQLVRSFGGFAEPVQTPNAISIFASDVLIPTGMMPAPGAPVLSQTAGGTKAARTYFVRTTFIDAAGGETHASPESSFAVALNNLLVIASPTVLDASIIAYNVYIGTAANSGTLVTQIPLGSAFTESTTALPAGVAYPTVNRTGYTVGSSGIITFRGAVRSGVVLKWSGTYYWRCAFTQDTIDLINDGVDIWKSSKISFETVKL